MLRTRLRQPTLQIEIFRKRKRVRDVLYLLIIILLLIGLLVMAVKLLIDHNNRMVELNRNYFCYVENDMKRCAEYQAKIDSMGTNE